MLRRSQPKQTGPTDMVPMVTAVKPEGLDQVARCAVPGTRIVDSGLCTALAREYVLNHTLVDHVQRVPMLGLFRKRTAQGRGKILPQPFNRWG